MKKSLLILSIFISSISVSAQHSLVTYKELTPTHLATATESFDSMSVEYTGFGKLYTLVPTLDGQSRLIQYKSTSIMSLFGDSLKIDFIHGNNTLRQINTTYQGGVPTTEEILATKNVSGLDSVLVDYETDGSVEDSVIYFLNAGKVDSAYIYDSNNQLAEKATYNWQNNLLISVISANLGESSTDSTVFSYNGNGFLENSWRYTKSTTQPVYQLELTYNYYWGGKTTNVNSIAEGVTVYPNPAKEVLFVDGVSGSVYQVISATGSTVQSGVVQSGGIDVSSLSVGVYTLYVTNKGRVVTEKFVKQ